MYQQVIQYSSLGSNQSNDNTFIIGIDSNDANDTDYPHIFKKPNSKLTM